MLLPLPVRRLTIAGTALVAGVGLTLAAWTGFRTPEAAGAPTTATTDLRADLLAAEASARDVGRARGAAVVVSALELGESEAPARAEAPTRRAPAPRLAAPRAVAPRAVAPRVVTRAAVRRAPERAPAPVTEAPGPQVAEAPVPALEVEPMPAEPVVAAPSRTSPSVDEPPRRRRGGWSTTADVIRNAPFPINP